MALPPPVPNETTPEPQPKSMQVNSDKVVVKNVKEAKKTKKTVSMASAIASLLKPKPTLEEFQQEETSSKPRSSMQKDKGILSRRRAPARKIDEARIEAAAKKLLKARRKAKRIRFHNQLMRDNPLLPSTLSNEKERRLIATRGVTAIFNAVREKVLQRELATRQEKERRRAALAAASANIVGEHNGAARNKVNGQNIAEDVNTSMQTSFLDLLKASMSSAKKASS